MNKLSPLAPFLIAGTKEALNRVGSRYWNGEAKKILYTLGSDGALLMENPMEMQTDIKHGAT